MSASARRFSAALIVSLLAALCLMLHGPVRAQQDGLASSASVPAPTTVSPLAYLRLPAGERIDLDHPLPAGGAPVTETRRFHGLAHYLNGLRFYRVTADGPIELRPGEAARLSEGEWFAATGRFRVLAIRGEGTGIEIDERSIELEAPGGQPEVSAVVAPKPLLHELDPALDKLRYAHLWGPLAALSRLVESAIVFLERTVDAGWAVALILFAVLVKLALLPVSLATARFQREASAHRAALAPMIESIKREYSGEEAHNRIMGAHKSRGITPFYTLKPMLGLFVLLPVLVAVFNALAEMPQFAGASLLWVKDLAYPDDVARLPFTLPWLGDTFHLLPWLMATVSAVAGLRFCDPHASAADLRRKRRGLVLMSGVFLVLFYPFPGAMVLYWLLNNLLQMVQQEVGP